MKINRNHMKKTLFLAVAASLIGASPLKAADLFITGSTAFRSNVHDACLKLFSGTPTEFTGLPSTGGDTKTGNAAAQWTITGTPIGGLGVSAPFTIHALFTGSVQGGQTVEQGTRLFFLDSSGNKMTNTPTIAYSDCSTTVTPYPIDGVNFQEEQVAVLPFAMVRSAAPGMSVVTNVTWDQLKTIVSLGRLPLSSWTGKVSDESTYVYLIKRTKDSGTLRTETAEAGYAFGSGATVYNYDVTNNVFYKATNTVNGANGGGTTLAVSVGVVGPPGNNNANLSSTWGPGYVGGGDIGTVMKNNNAANMSITMLSMSDAKSLTGSTFSQIIPFNGGWPTAAGSGIAGATTNDFTPYTLGQYSLWGYEVCIYPIADPSSLHTDQNLTASQLGDQNTSGTILGTLDFQTSGTPVAGSLENEIQNSKTGAGGTTAPATAIRINDMHATRAIVGGPIFP
jgi:hypothetical protein